MITPHNKTSAQRVSSRAELIFVIFVILNACMSSQKSRIFPGQDT